MKANKKSIGVVISDFRKIKKISQQKMANDLSLSLKEICEIESSLSVRADKLLLIAEYLGVTVNILEYFTLSEAYCVSKSQKQFIVSNKSIVEQLLYIALTGNTKPFNEITSTTENFSES